MRHRPLMTLALRVSLTCGLLLATSAFAAQPPAPAPTYDQPGKDSPARKAILDAIRPRLEKDLRFRPIMFVRSHATSGDYALAYVIPLQSDGKLVPDKTWTTLKKESGNTFALLTRKGTSWTMLEYDLGSPGFDFFVKWKPKHPKVPAILWEVVGTAMNAEPTE